MFELSVRIISAFRHQEWSLVPLLYLCSCVTEIGLVFETNLVSALVRPRNQQRELPKEKMGCDGCETDIEKR